MRNKIPIRIEWINGKDGSDGDTEIIMELGDFESSYTSIRSDIKEFKEAYATALRLAKKIEDENDTAKRNTMSALRRWKACKILADFNRDASNKFTITNYKQAYARDFGLPVRSMRAFLDFGQSFSQDEVSDQVPYSIYAEIVFRINGLRAKGIFESEKRRLVKMTEAGNVPNRNEYRKQLNDIMNSTEKPLGV